MSTDVSQELRRQLAELAYHVCEYCLMHEDDTFWGCQVDHIISRKHGGMSELTNLAWACAICNSFKGTDIATLVGKSARLCRLFHPRSNRWSSHFHLSGALIEARTEIGTGTINLLRLNDPKCLDER